MSPLTKTISLTEAQIETIDTAPIEIMPAPGPGKMFVLLSAHAYKTAGNAASAGTANIVLKYTGDADNDGVLQFSSADAATGFLGDNANYRIQNAVSSTVTTGETDCRNKGITLAASADIAAATGTTAKIVINFQIINA